MITNEGNVCTNCASYVLVIPQCEDASGEWGACGKFKQIVNWDETCPGWWEANPDCVRLRHSYWDSTQTKEDDVER